MEFYTAYSEKRPVRLCDKTRQFAYESLYEHRYGRDTLAVAAVSLDDHENFEKLSELDRYDIAILEIAKKAPIRICEGELISTAATLGDAIGHSVPARYENRTIFGGISHLTIDFSKVLRIGLAGIKEEICSSLENHTKPEKIRFLKSCLCCIDAFELWKDRYISALSEKEGCEDNLKNLSRVPLMPAESFHEAVQSIWAIFAFCRLCGNWPGIGRIDQLLGGYLKKDLSEGKITLCEAREILAHFFIKGCEWVAGGNYVSGDAQHYQNIVIGGVDSNGDDAANDVTYLVLDIIEELGISDFPTAVRISKNTPCELTDRVAEVTRYGGGILSVYNEDLVINALTSHGYSLSEAQSFANDGCWEVQIPGKTYFGYSPFDALQVLQQKTLRGYNNECVFSDFEELYSAFQRDIKSTVEEIFKEREKRLNQRNRGYYGWNESGPCSVISLFEDGCIEKGLSYCDGGAIYNVTSPHIGGLADVANELYAIKKLCFDEKRVTLSELFSALRSDWEENEKLRQHVNRAYEYYGNDNDEADLLAARILSDFADSCNALENRIPVTFPPGVSTFGRQIDWSKERLACAFGRKKGDILANNMAPTPGTAFKGATAIINSYCKSDLSRMANGAALDIRLLVSDVRGEAGLKALSALIRSFVLLGGFYMQIDVADAAVLKDAQQHPEKYPALSVRVAGWSARFVTLSKEWQNMIIENTEK